MKDYLKIRHTDVQKVCKNNENTIMIKCKFTCLKLKYFPVRITKQKTAKFDGVRKKWTLQEGCSLAFMGTITEAFQNITTEL